MKRYKKNHDLSLSAWGPYSKGYVGISHIPSPEEGKRFDLSVFPSLYRRGLTAPNVMWESGYHPWDCSPDLTRYTHRHELLWKDQIYTDVTFSVQDDSRTLFCCRSVNRTDSRQALVFHHMGSLHFPPVRTYSREPVRSVNPPVGEGLLFVDALDYTGLTLKENHPQRNLSPDGVIWGEVRNHGLSHGSGLGMGFGESPEDQASYAVPEDWDRKGTVHLRFRAEKGTPLRFFFRRGLEGDVKVTASGDWDLIACDCTVGLPGEEFLFTTEGTAPVELDGFVFCRSGSRAPLDFTPVSLNTRPQIIPLPDERSLLLKYDGLDDYYGLAWDLPAVIRQWECDEPDNLMKHNVHEHNDRVFTGQGEGHFTEVFTRPVYLEGAGEQLNYGLVCRGTEKEVRRMLKDFNPEGSQSRHVREGLGQDHPAFSEENDYAFSVNRLAATALLNVVYPVRVQGDWIRHHTPGRWWDCLYTWDSGFIGLGFTVLDLKRAEENLNTYLTLPGNRSAAFIHHGSPVPTQFFLYQELFNQSGSVALLEKYYDSLLQYHRFMAGRLGSSTTGALESGLLKTWDYFYNSGGWDDYCAQLHMKNHQMEDRVSPAITTAMAIRTALILKGAARILNRSEEELDRDIARFSQALQDHSWDEESGYFSYVVHDEEGQPAAILRDEGGVNYNCGFDGAYPLNAGICTPDQESALMEKLFSPAHLWTDSGLTAIDQSASYFKDNGYWNGAVWMAHQWVFWKTMLDLGKNDEAFLIASTALKLWKKEVEETYNCFEHFVTTTGKGAGWHQFGGLSSPVLNWYASYYSVGQVTAGHDTWILSQEFTQEHRRGSLSLMNRGGRRKENTLLVVLNPEITRADAFLDGNPIPSSIRMGGTVEVQIPADAPETYRVEIRGVAG